MHSECAAVVDQPEMPFIIDQHVGLGRAGDLDRLLNGAHSQLHEWVAGWFAIDLPEWILVPEVSFAVFAERGVIDILAWHPGRRALLIIELKTDIVCTNGVIHVIDAVILPPE